MSYRNMPFTLGEFYHVYNRGNSKQNIFLDFADYVRFQDLLYLANSVDPISIRDARRSGVYETQSNQLLVAIGAYCLMSNHFHILVTPIAENGVSLFMKKISTGYAMYFNKRYKRTGGLFEGKFKSEYVDSDEYLKYLFSYIHLNPLKIRYKDWKKRVFKSNELLEKAVQYKFSSYQDYVQDTRNESMILTKDSFPHYFIDESSWNKEMLNWIQYTQIAN